MNKAALLKSIEAVVPIEEWDDFMIDGYLDELRAIGVTDNASFDERYRYSTDDRRPFYDFAWYLYFDCHDLGDELMALKGLVIDWQATWDCYLSTRYDYFPFYETIYFFKKAYVTDEFP